MKETEKINRILKDLSKLTSEVKLQCPDLLDDCLKFQSALSLEYCKNNQLNLF